MSYTTVPQAQYNLNDLTKQISRFSLVGESGPIEEMGAPINQEGTPQYNRGLSLGEPTSSPFNKREAPTDHLVDLLTENANSSRLHAESPAQSKQWLGTDPSGDLDLEGAQPGVFTTGLGQNDGKKLNGKDLHVELLQGTYTYTHAAGTPWESTGTSGPSPGSPGNSVFQDITPEHVTGPLGSPSDQSPSFNYFDNGPQTAFNS
tara:strand:+ start:257 stop:868 length:612 start_codon:yes stop_codon:yes gene_type:complete